ncbi:hypothetical protein [Kineosporia succinea]|uniref:ANTAR domain-containing protein n=1 Tax=Kineosporia succinea TaxID=84632 RepID=A0ABT9P6I1_9ACTN|nr:hypothetical protein [Kineosporia succinea]MDP9828077.1 hypothetical protein [Kineosporia succinea]
MTGAVETIVKRAVSQWRQLLGERTEHDLATVAVLQTALDDHDLTDQALGRLTRAVLAEREATLVARHRALTEASAR